MTYRSFVAISIVAGFFAAGEGFDWPILRQAAAALGIVVAASYIWSRLAISGLSARRRAEPSTVQVGGVVHDMLEIRSTSRVPKLWIEVRDRSSLPTHDAGRVVGLGSRGTQSWETISIAVKRGVYALGPITLSTGDPFGLFDHDRRVDFSQQITVLPPVFDLGDFSLPGARATGGRRIDRITPHRSAAVASIRDYVPGDPFNRISWTASARTGALMVKEFDLDPTAEVWIVADFDADQRVRASREAESSRRSDLTFAEAWLDSSEDFVAAIAASVSRQAIDAKRSLGYLSTSTTNNFRPPDSSERQYLEVLAALATARSDGVEPIDQLLIREMRRFDRYRSPVVITASLDTRWIDTLERSMERGIQPTAIFIDPGSFDNRRGDESIRQRLAVAPFPTYIVDFRQGIRAAFESPYASGLSHRVFDVN